jgi:predicted transcriptional regulator
MAGITSVAIDAEMARLLDEIAATQTIKPSRSAVLRQAIANLAESFGVK